MKKVHLVKMDRLLNGRFIKDQYVYRGKVFKRVKNTYATNGFVFKIGRYTFETEAAVKAHIDETIW